MKARKQYVRKVRLVALVELKGLCVSVRRMGLCTLGRDITLIGDHCPTKLRLNKCISGNQPSANRWVGGRHVTIDSWVIHGEAF